MTVDDRARAILAAIDALPSDTFEDLDATVDAVARALGTFVTRNRGDHRGVHLRFLQVFFQE